MSKGLTTIISCGKPPSALDAGRHVTRDALAAVLWHGLQSASYGCRTAAPPLSLGSRGSATRRQEPRPSPADEPAMWASFLPPPWRPRGGGGGEGKTYFVVQKWMGSGRAARVLSVVTWIPPKTLGRRQSACGLQSYLLVSRRRILGWRPQQYREDEGAGRATCADACAVPRNPFVDASDGIAAEDADMRRRYAQEEACPTSHWRIVIAAGLVYGLGQGKSCSGLRHIDDVVLSRSAVFGRTKVGPS